MGRADEGAPVAAVRRRAAKRSSTSRTSSRRRRRRCSPPLQNAILDLVDLAPAERRARRRRPQHRSARLPFAHARARGAARPPARAVRRRSARSARRRARRHARPRDDRAADRRRVRQRAAAAPHPVCDHRPAAQRGEPGGRRAARCARRSRRRAFRRARCSTCCSGRSLRAASASTPMRWQSVHRWIQVSGIRWGLDANTRAALDLPADGALHVRRRARPAVRGLRVAGEHGGALRRTPSGGRCRRLGSAGARRVRALRRAGSTRLRALAARRQTPAQWFDALHDVLAALVAAGAGRRRGDRAKSTSRSRRCATTCRSGGVDEPLRLAVVAAALAATIDAPDPRRRADRSRHVRVDGEPAGTCRIASSARSASTTARFPRARRATSST